MSTLSEEEARYIVKDMLSTIRTGIKEIGAAIIHIAEIEKRYDSVRREGNSSDVYYKIAGAAFEHGIATDIVTTKHTGMAIMFHPADASYKKPSPEIFKILWRRVKRISDKGYSGPPSYFMGIEVENVEKT